jgi:hypothetical protein
VETIRLILLAIVPMAAIFGAIKLVQYWNFSESQRKDAETFGYLAWDDESLIQLHHKFVELIANGKRKPDYFRSLEAIKKALEMKQQLAPKQLDTLEVSQPAPVSSFSYEIFIIDNFHSGSHGESSRTEAGNFASSEAAIIAAKDIVDRKLRDDFRPSISKEDLLELYKMFGDTPVIVTDDPTCAFSAWDYAEMRCRQICDEEWWHDE